MSGSTVFVTGANGFIAQYIVIYLLEKGYTVIGSVRSASKGEPLKANLNSPRFSYVVIPDLIEEGAFTKVLTDHKEIEIILHTASPVIFNTKDVEKDILDPAIKGTKNILKAIKEHAPQVKKLVYTSSVAAIINHPSGPEDTVNEDSWNKISYADSVNVPGRAYRGSKTFAEKAIWDFINNEKPNFVVTTVNPPYVLGPQAFDSEVKGSLNLSNQTVSTIFNLKPADEVPEFSGAFVDVKSVALAHVLALETPETDGKRLLPYKGLFSQQEFLDIIRKEFPQLQDKLPVGQPGKYVYTSPKIDNSRTNKLLPGLNYLSLGETIKGLIQQLLDNPN